MTGAEWTLRRFQDLIRSEMERLDLDDEIEEIIIIDRMGEIRFDVRWKGGRYMTRGVSHLEITQYRASISNLAKEIAAIIHSEVDEASRRKDRNTIQ